jgi:aerobic carbon-monoxide dehydrogenase large subunit
MNDAAAPRWGGRIEDEPLLRGHGRYMDDVRDDATAIAWFVRSPHAHAHIRAIDIAEARRSPQVLAVLTAADIVAAGVGNVARPLPVIGRDGAPMRVPHRPALADTRVLHVGQPVVLVVAESLAAAQDAADLVAIDYEPLPAVTDVRAAIASDAPLLWPEAPGNIAVDWPGPVPDSAARMAAVEQALARAPHVALVTLVNQRIVVSSMEPRGATARYDPATGDYTLRCCSQGVPAMRDQIAGIMGLEPAKLRVLTDDVGGAFGMKTSAYPEYPALLVAAKLTGRAVHWMSTRSEAFVSDNQARDTVVEAALGLDAAGRFLALRMRAIAAMGGFLSSHGAYIATGNFARCLPTLYHVPEVAADVRCVYTNTVPTGPYRGAGRPEANYAMERLIDAAARLTGIDRVELRRRNMIAPSMLPYATPVGTVYDSGDFAAVLDQALVLADYAGFAARRTQSEAAGLRRGIGISCFLEHSGGMPKEGAALVFRGGPTVSLELGVHQSGQGHRTVFGRLAAERLGIAPDQVTVRQGDTKLGVLSGSSVASRSTITVGSAIVRTVEVVIEKGRRRAAMLLEAAEADIDYRAGGFEIAGTDRRLSLFEVAERAREAGEPLDTNLVTETPQTFPNGCHIAEIEIDPETGAVRVVGYTAVDDCGTVLDHTIVEAQVHGAVAQGLGQALLEHAVYEDGSGQLIAGSFMDYAMPRADDLPTITGALHTVPATTNPLGVKGVGEAGTTASLAAIMNAVADAVPEGATLDMPATPFRVWQACRPPRAGTAP